MDHLALQCKKKLDTFRIKELKDVLSRIGAGKQGKKQALVDKIMAIILLPERGSFNSMGLKVENMSSRYARNREDVAKVIDDVDRLRRFGAPDLATRIENGIGNGLGNVPVSLVGLAPSSEQVDVPNGKTRCPCGNPLDLGRMIQCETPSCLAWQHVSCVIMSEKEDSKPEIPGHFFCEICRIQLGDPFCVSIAHPLSPVKTSTSFVYSAEGGSSTFHNLEASFTLSHNDRELLRDPLLDLQIWCVLLGDEVSYRMHWPLKADLRVNGDFVRVTNRPGQQKLGVNGRDDGPVITEHTREGLNRILFTAYDGRSFCIGIRIIQRLTISQVMSCIPSEVEGESFDVALSRVRRCIGGSGSGGAVGDDSDSDIEVVSEYVTVNLRCPMSGSRMEMAGRFKPCIHMGCFDLCTFVELNQRARKWQCPICLKNYSLKDLVIDPFFARITRALKRYDEDVTEVEMKPDGCWRPKVDGDAKLTEPWRFADGLIRLANSENNVQEKLNAVKIEEEVVVEKLKLPLKIGFKRTQDGSWKVNRTVEPAGLPMSNKMLGHNHQSVQKGAWSQSSIIAASNEDYSVNQEPMDALSMFERDEVEVNSFSVQASVNTWPNGLLGGDLDQLKTSEIIVLSDTEEDNLNIHNVEDERFAGLHPNIEENDTQHLWETEGRFINGDGLRIAVPFTDLGTFQRNTTAPLDFLGTGGGDNLASPDQEIVWSTGAPFELFSTIPDDSTTAQSCHLPICSTPVQAPMPNGASNIQPREINLLEVTYTDHNQSLHGQDNHVLGTNDTTGLGASSDSSLRNFLPHQPARSTVKTCMHEPWMALNDDIQAGWFSLSLGGRESISDALFDVSYKKAQHDPLCESASVLLDLSNHGTRVDGSTVTPKRTKGAFTSFEMEHFKVPCSLVLFTNEIPL